MVIENVLDRKSDYISRYFTPNRSVTELAYQVYQLIYRKQINANTLPIQPDSITYYFESPKFKDKYPLLQPFTKILLLESFAIYYAVKYDIHYRRYLDERDMIKVRENLKYIISIIGIDPNFSRLTELLHDLSVDLGYIQSQIPIIKNEVV